MSKNYYMKLEYFKEDGSSIEVFSGILDENYQITFKDENEKVIIEKDVNDDDIDAIIDMLRTVKEHGTGQI